MDDVMPWMLGDHWRTAQSVAAITVFFDNSLGNLQV